jgi:hypothetical protein
LVDALDELDARLDVGLNFSDYSERVGDVSVAYNRVDFEAVGGYGSSCLATAILLEEAFNKYIGAKNRWNDCITDPDCTNESIERGQQADWEDASEKLDEARATFPE